MNRLICFVESGRLSLGTADTLVLDIDGSVWAGQPVSTYLVSSGSVGNGI